MPDTCPTCGAEVRIVGETTKHYEAGRSLDALNTQAKAVSRLRERVEELEEALGAVVNGAEPNVEYGAGYHLSDDDFDRARQALDTGEDDGC